MANSLLAVLSRGVRPLGVKASLQSWLGVPITLQTGAFWQQYLGTGSFLNKSVSVDQTLQLSTAWACVRLISQTMATLPLGFYKRKADGSRDMASSHQLYEILHNQPNQDMTAVVFWEVVVASLLLWGNAYIEILRDGIGAVMGLNFLHPSRMVYKMKADGSYDYYYRDMPNGKERIVRDANLMHIPAFSTDGKFGISPVQYGANVFGTAIETDRASAETFRDSMRSPGVMTMDAVLKPAQREEIRAHIKDVSENGGVMVLEKGASYHQLSFDPKSAELLASREWNCAEVARWFGVDPTMIGHGGKDSNWGTGLEQKMLWFLTFTLRQWCVRIEQAVRKNLLTPVERQTLFAEYNMDALLRSDSAGRAAFFSTMANTGILTRDEIRALDNWPPMGGNAAVLTVQSALINIDDMNKGTNSSAIANPAVAAMFESAMKGEQ